MSNPIMSVTYTPRPQDRRCRYWCKVLSTSDTRALLDPADVHGANDLPGPYLRSGDDVELFEGDWVLEGEEVSHRRQRGWAYTLGHVIVAEGECLLEWQGQHFKDKEIKVFLRERGDRDGLRGSGDVAAMVRFIRAVNAGYGQPAPVEEPATAEVSQ